MNERREMYESYWAFEARSSRSHLVCRDTGVIFTSGWSCCLCCLSRGLEIEAVIGLHRHSAPDSYTVRVPVSDVILNTKYNNPSSPFATRGTSDIMLLKLAYPVEFNDAVTPVCLPSLFQAFPEGKRCYSSGWGATSHVGKHILSWVAWIIRTVWLTS